MTWTTHYVTPTFAKFPLGFIFYCKEANDPDDPAHQPVRVREAVTCSCGSTSLSQKWRVDRFWWPLVMVWKNKSLPVPHYVVCPYAKRGVDDPRHAPWQVDYHEQFGPVVSVCICGALPHRDDLQILPSY